MKYSGVNMAEVRTRNKSAILKLVNKENTISRKDIAAALGLTPAAVTNLCAELIENGLIKETGEAEQTKAGRKKIWLSLCLDDFYAVCVNMETDESTVSIVRLDGELVLSKKFMLNEHAEESIRVMSESINRCIHDCAVPKEKIIGIGMGLVGGFDPETNETSGNYGIWKSGINVSALVERYTGFKTVCDNNVKAFALAEQLYGECRDSDDVLFIKWSSGVGSALIMNSQICRDGPFGSQEIGHYIIDNNDARCRCGRTGCLETLVSYHSLSSYIKAHFPSESIDSVLDSEFKTEADGFIIDRISKFAAAVVNSSTVISPQRVVVFGKMWRKKMLCEFTDCCKSIYPFFDESYIVMSSLQDKSDYIGPTALVAEKLFFSCK